MIIQHISPKRSGHNYTREAMQSWLPEATIVDQENFRPKNIRMLDKEPMDVIVLQTRDLLNWTASYVVHLLHNYQLVNKPKQLSPTRMVCVHAWLAISMTFYGVTRYLEYRTGVPVVRIYYDAFTKSEEYRRQVCAELGGVYTEKTLKQVNGSGRGSSFSGLEYNGRGQEMNTLQRYRDVSGDIWLFYVYMFERHHGLLKFYKKHQLPNQDKLEFINQLWKKEISLS